MGENFNGGDNTGGRIGSGDKECAENFLQELYEQPPGVKQTQTNTAVQERLNESGSDSNKDVSRQPVEHTDLPNQELSSDNNPDLTTAQKFSNNLKTIAALAKETAQREKMLDNWSFADGPNIYAQSTDLYGKDNVIAQSEQQNLGVDRTISDSSANSITDVKVYEKPVIDAPNPMPPMSDSVKTAADHSHFALNVQITQVPEVSKGPDIFELGPILSTAMQAGSQATAESILQTFDRLTQPNAVNNDLTNLATHFATSADQLNNDAAKLAGDIGDAIDKPMSSQDIAKMAGMQMPIFIMGGKLLDPKFVEQMGLAAKTDEELAALNIQRKMPEAGEELSQHESSLNNLEKSSVITDGAEKLLKGYPINGAERTVPLGFKDEEQFSQAAKELQSALKASGIDDGIVGVRGSSVTGSSIYKGTQFNADSDIDFFVESKTLTDGFETSKKIPGFINPDDIIGAFKPLNDWSAKWSNILGRKITPGAFTPSTVPNEPAILVK